MQGGLATQTPPLSYLHGEGIHLGCTSISHTLKGRILPCIHLHISKPGEVRHLICEMWEQILMKSHHFSFKLKANKNTVQRDQQHWVNIVRTKVKPVRLAKHKLDYATASEFSFIWTSVLFCIKQKKEFNSNCYNNNQLTRYLS